MIWVKFKYFYPSLRATSGRQIQLLKFVIWFPQFLEKFYPKHDIKLSLLQKFYFSLKIKTVATKFEHPYLCFCTIFYTISGRFKFMRSSLSTIVGVFRLGNKSLRLEANT
uniref:Uncharacterized protein n=1 Tax=Udotea sp. TZ0819 TaxID=2364085 RepID=A0A386B283_9CHLO|nr:hypothetical protein [Udotea sp. TZ0819]